MQSPVVGLDAQGVIFDRDGAVLTEVPGAIESIVGLSQHFDRRVHLVTVALDDAEAVEVMIWLKSQRFFERTGIPWENVHFCKARREKPAACRELGVTHFADDRAEIVEAVLAVVPHCFVFRPNEEELANFPGLTERAPRINTWPELVDAIIAA